MFDGLRPMDWLFLLAALALGFGLVKFLLAHQDGSGRPPGEADPVERDAPPPADPPGP